MILINVALGIFLDSRCFGRHLSKVFFFPPLLLFLPLRWRHKWRVIVLFSRSLLNVSPTQIFGQTQEDRNVSGVSWGKKKMLAVGKCAKFKKTLNFKILDVGQYWGSCRPQIIYIIVTFL